MKRFFNFEFMITPVLVKTLYPIVSVLSVLVFIFSMPQTLAFARYQPLLGFTAFLIGCVGMVLWLLILRVIFEQMIVFFNIHQYVHKLAHPNEAPLQTIDSLNELKSEVKNMTK